jgi:hypothetical protein
VKIAIVGLAIPHPTGKELKKKGYTVWTLGRNADPDCDRYYELHGLQTRHPEKLVMQAESQVCLLEEFSCGWRGPSLFSSGLQPIG